MSRGLKIGVGAIAGIVIGIVVLLAAIILLIIVLLRRNRNEQPAVATDQSEEVDNDAMSQFMSNPHSDNWNENPLYSNPNSDAESQFLSMNNDNDPFMRDFEENL